MNLFLLLFTFSFSLHAIEGGQLASEKQLLDTGTVATLRERQGKIVNHCTAVRISENVILTAAHCVDNPDKFPVGIRQSLNPLDESVPMEKVIGIALPIEDYFLRLFMRGPGEKRRDIAVLMLEKKSMSPFPRIAPAESNEAILQFGYGLTSPEATWEAFPLSFLESGRVQSLEGEIIETMSSPGSILGGDSGGPLLNRNLGLLGIASMGDENGGALYISAMPYIDWIRKVTGRSNIQPHLKNLSHQYSERKPVLLTRESLVSVLTQECQKMKQISGTDWELRSRNCFPKDEVTCKKLPNGLLENSIRMDVIWDIKNSACVWADDV